MTFKKTVKEEGNIRSEVIRENIPSTTSVSLDKIDLGISAVISLLSFLAYLRTVAPSVSAIFDDSLELQLVSYQLGIAHPTGYPLYTLLGKLFTLLPFGDIGFRTNLMSAFWGALAVGLFYFCVIEIGRPSKTGITNVTLRIAAIIGGLTFAFSPDFWSQAVITEVYTFNIFLLCAVILFAFRWLNSSNSKGTSYPYALAFVFGLSLTHHRTAVLLGPALVVLLWFNRKSMPIRKANLKPLLRLAATLVLPFLLYLYIPIRGMSITSIDGTYQNTFSGFIGWISGSTYSVFLASDPWSNAASIPQVYFKTLLEQFGPTGLALFLLGVLYLIRSRVVAGLYLTIAYATFTSFALLYHVADNEPFFLPSFLVIAFLITFGIFALFLVIRYSINVSRSLPLPLTGIAAVLLLYLPYSNFTTGSIANNLSQLTEPRRFGQDILSQPLEQNANVVGLLGEVTLLRYLQDTEGIRKDLNLIAADEPRQRLNTITNLVASRKPVYTTHQLDGLAERFPLSSVGSLIKIHFPTERQIGNPTVATSKLFDEKILLLGYHLASKRLIDGKASLSGLPDDTVRLTLYWQPLRTLDENYSTFVHILDSKSSAIGQKDGIPVNDSYPTSLWRPGEIISDTIDVPLKPGASPGTYAIEVGLYKADGQRLRTEDGKQSYVLGSVNLGRAFYVPRNLMKFETPPATRIGNSLTLLSISLDRQSAKPGEKAAVELTWKAEEKPTTSSEFSVFLVGPDDKRILVNQGQPVYNTYPATEWEKGELVLDRRELTIPATLLPGDYSVLLLAGSSEPINLGHLRIEGRERNFQTPQPSHMLSQSLGDSIELLGYDLAKSKDMNKAGANQLETIEAILYWRSTGTPVNNYSVFLHVVDGDGKIIAQHDGQPQNGNAPTTSWLASEIVEDHHIVKVDSSGAKGPFKLRIGMYVPETNQRLTSKEGDFIEVPLEID